MSAREELAATIWNARNPGSWKWERLTSAERCTSDVRDIADVILASDWLAKHDAEVGAKALTDAADEVERIDRIGHTPYREISNQDALDFAASPLYQNSRDLRRADVAEFLRARATTTTEVGADG